MVMPLTVFVYMIVFLVLALAKFSPLILHAVATGYVFVSMTLPRISLTVAVSVSAVIALIVAVAFSNIPQKCR